MASENGKIDLSEESRLHPNQAEVGIEDVVTIVSTKEEPEPSTNPQSEVTSCMDTFCKRLNVVDDVHAIAAEKWRSIPVESLDPKANVAAIQAVIVYIASVDIRYPYGIDDPQAGRTGMGKPAVTVSQLLHEANTSLSEFFELFKLIKEFKSVSDAAVHALQKVKVKYCVTLPLYDKFEKIFSKIVHTNTASVLESESSTAENADYLKRFCWLLFIYAKGHMLSGNRALVLAFRMLLCCVDYVMKTSLAFLLQQPYDTLLLTSQENPQDNRILRQLCDQFNTSYEECLVFHNVYFKPVIEELTAQENNVTISTLESRYHELYEQEGDIDETLFLQSHHTLVLPNRGEANNNSPLPGRTQQHMVPPQTPVRSALTTVNQLDTLLENCSTGPSNNILKYFKRCPSDPRVCIETRVCEMEKCFVMKYALFGKVQQSTSQHRFTQATKLYYKVMETMLKTEEAILSKQDFSNLLNNATFHRSLLTCAIEVVIATHNVTWSPRAPHTHEPTTEIVTDFNWLLKIFELKAYDLIKVLDSFVKAEPGLTQHVLDHLQLVQQRVLESVAWRSDSPVFDAMSACDSVNSSPSAGSTFNPTLSPLRSHINTPPHIGSHGIIPPEGVNSPAKRPHSINVFLNKVCRLAHSRLKSLCTCLEIQAELMHRIWVLVEHCIMRKCGILRDRHLDQILMCSIYAMCRVADQDIKFKTIVAVYKNMPHSVPDTYKSVYVVPGERDSIINFYNRVFMHSLKSFILLNAANRAPAASLPISPSPGTLSSMAPPSPVYTLPGKTNFFVSPLKSSPFKVPQSPGCMTPRGKQLYCYKETIGTPNQFDLINLAMRKRALPGAEFPQSLKQFKFDDVTPSDTSRRVEDLTADMIVVKKGATSRKSLNFQSQSESKDKSS